MPWCRRSPAPTGCSTTSSASQRPSWCTGGAGGWPRHQHSGAGGKRDCSSCRPAVAAAAAVPAAAIRQLRTQQQRRSRGCTADAQPPAGGWMLQAGRTPGRAYVFVCVGGGEGGKGCVCVCVWRHVQQQQQQQQPQQQQQQQPSGPCFCHQPAIACPAAWRCPPVAPAAQSPPAPPPSQLPAPATHVRPCFALCTPLPPASAITHPVLCLPPAPWPNGYNPSSLPAPCPIPTHSPHLPPQPPPVQQTHPPPAPLPLPPSSKPLPSFPPGLAMRPCPSATW